MVQTIGNNHVHLKPNIDFLSYLCGNCPFNERIWLCDNTFVDWTYPSKTTLQKDNFFEACLPAHVRSKTDMS